jgi:hypothetical protein
MHDITGGHEKLQLLYLLFEKAFSRPSGSLFKRSLLAWEAATLLARISCFSAISHLSLIPLFFSFFFGNARCRNVATTRSLGVALFGANCILGCICLRLGMPLVSGQGQRFFFGGVVVFFLSFVTPLQSSIVSRAKSAVIGRSGRIFIGNRRTRQRSSKDEGGRRWTWGKEMELFSIPVSKKTADYHWRSSVLCLSGGLMSTLHNEMYILDSQQTRLSIRENLLLCLLLVHPLPQLHLVSFPST